MNDKDNFDQVASRAELIHHRAGAVEVLETLNLRRIITDAEISEAVVSDDNIYGHPLLLGVLMRLTRAGDEVSVRKWLVGLSAWKNLTVHPDLDGLSPQEYSGKHPTGLEESRIIGELMGNFEHELQRDPTFTSAPNREALQERFTRFQNHFLSLYPVVNPFAKEANHSMNNREIITEERRRSGTPEEKLHDIGLRLTFGSDADDMGAKAAKLEDEYQSCMAELAAMRENSPMVDEPRLAIHYARLKIFEPYMKGHEMGWAYYANLGYLAYELGEILDIATYLDKALILNPAHIQSREILEAVKNIMDKESIRREKSARAEKFSRGKGN